MSIYNALYLLLGAGLVAFGVLVAAARDLMLKNHRATDDHGHDSWEGWEWQPAPVHASSKPALYRQASHRQAPAKQEAAPEQSATARQSIPVIPRKPQRDKRPEVVVDQAAIEAAAMAKEVMLALVANGYDKATAQAAVDQVGKRDRASLETWMVAALRACSSGARGIA